MKTTCPCAYTWQQGTENWWNNSLHPSFAPQAGFAVLTLEVSCPSSGGRQRTPCLREMDAAPPLHLSPEAQWQHPVCNFLFTLKGAGLGIKKISGMRQFEMSSLLPSQLQVKVSVQIRQPPSHWESSSSWEEDPRHWCAIVEGIKVSESFLRLEEFIIDVFYFSVMLGYRWHSHLQASAQLSFQFAFTFIWLLYQRPPPLLQLDSPLYSQTALGHIKFLTWGVAESFPC